MTPIAPARTLDVRHLQLARAAFAAVAAIMVTFSPDHSATVGLSVFSGFAIATGLVFGVAAWLVFPAGRRWPSMVLGVLTLLAGLIASVGPWRSTAAFFAVVITWALVSGIFEAVVAFRGRADAASRQNARDGLTIGVLTIVLGLALLLVQPQYALDYYIEDAGRSFTLTGIVIAVGVFGGYAAIVAVFLGIAGFSPRRAPAPSAADRSIP
ncbi:DUF308 domain-containing protein [Microbacterium sp. P06]|uniref:DUF308 domain-containing protein n=1 Tax=unclassified Microbacterium TaxID=2609290 RepID=UPI003744C4B6